MNVLECYGFGVPALKQLKNTSVDEFIEKICYRDAQMILGIDENMKVKLHTKLNSLSKEEFKYYCEQFLEK